MDSTTLQVKPSEITPFKSQWVNSSTDGQRCFQVMALLGNCRNLESFISLPFDVIYMAFSAFPKTLIREVNQPTNSGSFRGIEELNYLGRTVGISTI